MYPKQLGNGKNHALESSREGSSAVAAVATGVAILAIAAIVATVVLIPGQSHIDSKWGRFTVVTTFFVVYCGKSYWRARIHLRFWSQSSQFIFWA
jgi:hypothetical protein